VQKKGSFVLLPFQSIIHRGELPRFSDAELALLPVLIAHENQQNRKAFPSQDRISILAGIRKKRVSEAISGLANSGWVHAYAVPLPGGRSRYEYVLKYPAYSPENKDIWFSLPKGLFLNGVWGDMPPSVKKLYLVLQALSWRYEMVEVPNPSSWLEWETAMEEGDESWERFVDSRFLVGQELDFATGLSSRTRRWAMEWLEHVGLFHIVDDELEEARPGAILEDAGRWESRHRLEKLNSRGVTEAPPQAKSMIAQRKRREKSQRRTTGLSRLGDGV
jgi:hypothetical protein